MLIARRASVGRAYQVPRTEAGERLYRGATGRTLIQVIRAALRAWPEDAERIMAILRDGEPADEDSEESQFDECVA
jgi:hypothetical protein